LKIDTLWKRQDVANGNVTAFGRELQSERPPHAGAAAGDHGEFSPKVLHTEF
jgi:hypothetical protein